MKGYLAIGLIIAQSHLHAIIIDNAKLCNEPDTSEMIFLLSDQLEEAMQLESRITLKNSYTDINHILFTGVDESDIASNMIKTLIQQESIIPISIHKNYDLPHWADEKTLVICLSYSGNTQETLLCFEAARKKNVPIIGITSGGILCDALLKNNYDVVHIPDELIPRAAFGHLSIPLLYLMKKIGIAHIHIDQEIYMLKKKFQGI